MLISSEKRIGKMCRDYKYKESPIVFSILNSNSLPKGWLTYFQWDPQDIPISLIQNSVFAEASLTDFYSGQTES